MQAAASTEAHCCLVVASELLEMVLNGGRVSRRHAAGTLWPCGDDERAAGNLRSWRLRGAGIDVLQADQHILHLDPELSVDITHLSQWATRVINCCADGSDLETPDLHPEAVHLLWVILERERL